MMQSQLIRNVLLDGAWFSLPKMLFRFREETENLNRKFPLREIAKNQRNLAYSLKSGASTRALRLRLSKKICAEGYYFLEPTPV